MKQGVEASLQFVFGPYYPLPHTPNPTLQLNKAFSREISQVTFAQADREINDVAKCAVD